MSLHSIKTRLNLIFWTKITPNLNISARMSWSISGILKLFKKLTVECYHLRLEFWKMIIHSCSFFKEYLKHRDHAVLRPEIWVWAYFLDSPRRRPPLVSDHFVVYHGWSLTRELTSFSSLNTSIKGNVKKKTALERVSVQNSLGQVSWSRG